MEQRKRIALISIGSVLRGDDGIAQAVCAELPDSILADTMHYDLELKTQLIGDCLLGAEAALIVDATKNGSAAGTSTILNLSPVLNKAQQLLLRSCHSLSFLDELRILERQGQVMPAKLVFFGIEVLDTGWKEGLSPDLQEKLPELREKLIAVLKRLQSGADQENNSPVSMSPSSPLD